MASAPDVITLDNFEAKMPKWQPNLSSHLYALVDMGRFVSPLSTMSGSFKVAGDVRELITFL